MAASQKRKENLKKEREKLRFFLKTKTWLYEKGFKDNLGNSRYLVKLDLT